MSNVLGARNGSGPDADELSLDGFSTDDDEGTNGGEYLDLDLARKTTAANRDSVTSLLGFSEYDDNELAAGYLDIDVVQQQAASIRESMNMSDYDDDETEDEDEGGGGYLQLGHGGANAGVTGPTPIVEPWEVFDAIVEDDEEELEVLIELGADVNIVDKEGYTPLQQAVMLGYQSMVAVLYDNGADLNQTNRAGQTALDMAVIGSKKKIARALSTHGAKHSANFVPPEAPTGLMKQGSFSGLVVGKKCTVKGYMGAGTIRFVGKHKIKNTDICGIELELKVGKNNGTVMGTKYFECPNRHGILCPSWKVTTKETPKPAQDDPISVVVSTARDVGGRPDSYSGFESPPTSPGPGSAVKYRDSLRGFGEGNQRPDSFAGFESDGSGESRTDEPSNGPIEPEAVQYGPGAYIQKVTKAGPAAQTGQFKVGMWVASLNGQDCMGLTKHDVIEIIKGAEQLLTFGLVFEGAASTGRIVVNGKIGLSFEDRMGVPAPDSSAPGAAIPEAASPASVSSIDMHTYDGKGRLALVGVLRKRGIYYDKARGKDPEYLYLDLGLHTQKGVLLGADGATPNMFQGLSSSFGASAAHAGLAPVTALPPPTAFADATASADGITLRRGQGEGFGVTVFDHLGETFITRVKPGGVADRTGLLYEGVRIDAVNGKRVAGSKKGTVLGLLKTQLQVVLTTAEDDVGFKKLRQALLSQALESTKREFQRIHMLCKAFESRIVPPRHEVLPKGARKAKCEGSILYVILKKRVAQLDHPGPKLKNTAKVPKGLKIPKAGSGKYYYIAPQPAELPPTCIQLLLLDAAFEGSCTAEYLNPETRRLSPTHPRDAGKVKLHIWWEEGTWFDMRMSKHSFWMNTATRMITLDDPREVEFPKGSVGLTTLCYGHARTRRLDGDVVNWTVAEVNNASYNALDRNRVTKGALPDAVWNKVLNRHLDIMPCPQSRVTVGTEDESEVAQYINANYIRGFNGDRREYIGAQGPKAQTVYNFWRMVNEHECPVIVMSTKFVEKEKSKCFEYFPTKVGGALEFGCRVECAKVEKHSGYLHSVLHVTVHPGSPPRTVHHFFYNTWPDHGVPKKNKKPFTSNVLRMLEQIETIRTTLQNEQGGNIGPSVVHCSAGVGRTGTIIAIDHARHLLRHKGKVDCKAIVKNIRQDRVALVQHENQFEFLHAACSRYAKTVGRTMSTMGQEPRLPTLIETHDMVDQEVEEKLAKKEGRDPVQRHKSLAIGESELPSTADFEVINAPQLKRDSEVELAADGIDSYLFSRESAAPGGYVEPDADDLE